MPTILVGSVYGESPRTAEWYSLQHRFLRKTSEYSHVAFVNGSSASFVDASLVVGRSSEPDTQQRQHLRGLQAILEHFRRVADDYAGFLILDSDAFPCAPGWVDRLMRAMAPFRLAAVVRHENLDVFAHPCALFALPDALPSLDIRLAPQTNLLGESFLEVGCTATSFFPLLRSNRRNHHPIMGAIYWSSFYHHGAGSRTPIFRASAYHVDFADPANDARIDAALFEALTSNPDDYIRSLVTMDDPRSVHEQQRTIAQ